MKTQINPIMRDTISGVGMREAVEWAFLNCTCGDCEGCQVRKEHQREQLLADAPSRSVFRRISHQTRGR